MTWKKGQSGNPSGLPKITQALAERARKFSGQALSVLVEALKDPDRKVQIMAANILLDRGYGKPGQPITGADGEKAVSITIDLGAADKPD